MRGLAALGMALAVAAAALAGGQALAAGEEWIPHREARVILLNKLQAQPMAVTLREGQARMFGTLTVTLESCFTRPADEPRNAAAFLKAVDSRGTAPAFKGWIFSETPAVSQLQHPLYDVRLVTCQ